MPTDPWVIVLMCPTQANAKLMLAAIREAGVESSAAIAKRSEARAILGEMSATAGVYNKAGLDAIAEQKAQKVDRIRKAQPRANRNRL